MCGKHDNRDERIGTVRRGPDHACEINAIERLHHPVRQHGIGRKVLQFVIGLAAFLRRLDVAGTEGIKHIPDQGAHRRIVFEEQDVQLLKAVCQARVNRPLDNRSAAFETGGRVLRRRFWTGLSVRLLCLNKR